MFARAGAWYSHALLAWCGWGDMKNFLRGLRFAWPYRGRLIVSIICAVLAAALWGLNFTCIYPTLKLLHAETSLLAEVDILIAGIQRDIDKVEVGLEGLQIKARELDRMVSNRYSEQMRRDATRDLVKQEGRLENLRRSLYHHRLVRKFVQDWLPLDPFHTLGVVLGFVLIAVVLKCCFEFCQDWLVGSVINLGLFDLRNEFFRKVLRQDADQFGDRGSADLMSRFTTDMEALGLGTKTLFGRVVAEPLKAVACVVLACMISWQLTLLFLIMVPIAGYLLGRIGRTMKQATRKMLERVSNIYRILQEVLGGIKVVKAYTTEPRERMRFREATRDYYNRAMRVVKIDSLTGPAIEILGVAAIVLALMAGSYLVLRKQTSFMGLKFSEQPLEAEALLQLYVLLAAIADPVRKLSSVFTKIQAGGAAADRIFECLDREPRIVGNSDGPRLARSEEGQLEAPPVRGILHPPLIEFRDVCFSYDPGRPILSHMSFKVHRGETIAIVGGNGSGKSTLLSLLPRFRDPDHGSVMILGHDLRSINLRSLRHNLGLVSQDIVLFDDTIHGNIAYGARGATREQVEQAATRAFAHDFITRLAQGYDTPVGECGGKLSGGQKQRICLARAILRDPAILLLDEFTSQTDAESETLIHRAMADFVRGRTTFMITHRMHTLEMASRIMVLDHGHIVAFGTEEELLRVCPVFQRLSEPGGELHAA